MATLSERLRQKKQSNSENKTPKAKGLKANNLAIPAVDAGVKSLNRSSIVNEKLLEIDPLQCKPWSHHNRHIGWLDKQKLNGLIESISEDGQLQPGLVRKTKDNEFPYEIIFGVRRWSACKALGKKFRARITTEDDKSCIRLMHFENEESRNISPLEKSFAYANQLDSGLYRTQAEFAEEMNITVRHLSRLLRIAKLKEHTDLTDLLFKFVDQLSLRAVEEVASIVTNVGDHLSDAIANVNQEIDSGKALSFPEVIKLLRNGVDQKDELMKSDAKIYLKKGRRALVQASRKKNEIKISLKHGIEMSEDIEAILLMIAKDCKEGNL